METIVFKNKALPFVELRYVKEIPACSKKHLHKELTFTAIKKGQLNIEFNENNFLLDVGEIVLINKDIVHCATLNRSSKDGYVLYLDEEFLIENSFSFPKRYEHLKQKDLYERFIFFCDSLLDKNISLIEKKELLYLFCLDIFTSKSNDKKDEENQNLSSQIKEYLDENFLEEISLDDLSRRFGITEVHLIRVFKKSFGLPIHSYILNKKVHLAKELLLSKAPIVEVALKSGFFDQSHLNRCFKRVFQITPKQFQKNILDKC
ncbi:AraC family transcriptional regulator [Halarcobacter sp.]|uniref:AraC family transcriptional regulator n=1 Tax=Halarcobacter sp. TaxID=2321133 RepID=UPI0029F50321|nr:AraC family transcriptional regulator [Halarcobacter sp.]